MIGHDCSGCRGYSDDYIMICNVFTARESSDPQLHHTGPQLGLLGGTGEGGGKEGERGPEEGGRRGGREEEGRGER